MNAGGKNNNLYISSTYLKVVLASDANLNRHIEKELPNIYLDINEHEFLSDDSLEKVFTLLSQSGIGSLLLSFGKNLELMHHGPLGVCAVYAPTIMSAFNIFSDFSCIRSNYVSSDIVVDKQHVYFNVTPHSHDDLTNTWLVEVALYAVLSMLRILLPLNAQSELELSFTTEQSNHTEQIRSFFGVPCSFGLGINALVMPVGYLNKPSPLHEPEVFDSNLRNCQKLRSALLRPDQLKDVVGQALVELLRVRSDCLLEKLGRDLTHSETLTPSVESAAASLSLSARTLSRKLQQEGTSFKNILSEVRQVSAKRLLKETELPVADIADLLWYREHASFTRAFKKQMSTTPREWRVSSRLSI